MNPIIDTHAHLDHVPEIEAALERATQAGVSDIVAVSTDLKAIKRNLELKKLHSSPRIHVALGIHPGDIKVEELDETFAFIRANIKDAVAIGETGLDYSYKWARKNDDEQKKQRDCFRRHLELALEFNLPIVIHSRGAEEDCLAMARTAGIRRALFHWYSGPVDVLAKVLNEGYYVSCSPSVGYSAPSRAAMTNAPVERTLIETDSPVYFNQAGGGFPGEPKEVWRTLKSYAALKNIDEGEALLRLNANAKEFFQI
jgi:TatD DNase family protein